MKINNNKVKLSIVLIIALISGVLEFIFHYKIMAQSLITILGSILALIMFIDMIKVLKSGKFGVDLLAITAVVATLAVGQYWASLIVLLMLTGGDTLEDFAASKANTELKELLSNTPKDAHLLVDGKISNIDVDDVKVDDILIVKPSELVPVDGILIEGTSDLNEASLTGESVPVTKTVGDSVMSGSINGDNSISMKATTLAKDSQYQEIIKLVKQSEERPAHFVRMADRYAVPFTLLAYLIAGISYFISKDPVRIAQVLVVASPCPLILAAPISLISGMSRSSRNGIIVKTGTTIEKLSKIKSIAFDKTGTITSGKLKVDEIVNDSQLSDNELYILAASVEQQSNHILARSLVEYVGASKLKIADDVNEVTAKGVSGVIDSKLVKVGKLSFVDSKKEKIGLEKTAVHISIDNEYAGSILFSDQIRPEAAQTMNELKEMNVHNIIMLTGDHQSVAQKVAKEINITQVYAGCLPQDKIDVLDKTAKQDKPIAMVGDGVNDAPSLVVADVGIAMGASGATAASESADAVIVRDDLSKVTKAIQISKDTMRISKESVLIGIFICIGLMIIAAFGFIPTIIGALFQEVVDTVTILYALKARRDR
ncbi:cobalt ABC transporter ATP-binding protein [Companilactobacillus sp. RD055328]|uniref:heavy metal translocating P-type ATPase n=1 Tax=Companilactobacillus sp. RD055328 TaxID=2916634 RepID=UPI001FC8C3AB|nr:heavy metal translocating P-type ATPase [Companilactobacillus sp. RD055328]GKQ42467.1 cobalt ABC transporter ATP-binding protein [Companilactobacillus sp. RD055328]